MPLYLSKIIGDGLTPETAFRPIGLEEPGAGWINFNPAMFGIVYLPTPKTAPGLVKLADSVTEKLPLSIITTIKNRFGITITSDTLSDILSEMLILHAREDGTRWRPLKPSANILEIWLGGLGKIFSQPIISGGANLFSDNFNRADSDTIGADWTERDGDFDIVTNAVQCITNAAVAVVYWSTVVSTADYTVQAVLVNVADVGNDIGVCGRRVNNGAADSNFYAAIQEPNWLILYLRSGGSWFTQALVAQAKVNGDVIKLSMNGSTIKVIYNGVEKISITDSNLSAAGNAGISAGDSAISQRWDDFTVDDFGAGGDIRKKIIPAYMSMQ